VGSRTVGIRLPEELAILLERDEVLKSMAEGLLAEELSRLLLKVLVLDKLAERSELTEQDVVELDKRIKRGLRSRIEAEAGAGHE